MYKGPWNEHRSSSHTNMVASLSRLLGAVALLSTFVASSPLPVDPVPRYFSREPVTRGKLSVLQVQKELGPLLSAEASIIGPKDPAWANVTYRWVTVDAPEFELAVQAGKEEDVAKIVSCLCTRGLFLLTLSGQILQSE